MNSHLPCYAVHAGGARPRHSDPAPQGVPGVRHGGEWLAILPWALTSHCGVHRWQPSQARWEPGSLPCPCCTPSFPAHLCTQCSIHFLLPAAYYLATVFEEEPGQQRYEKAVLAAVNSVSSWRHTCAHFGLLAGLPAYSARPCMLAQRELVPGFTLVMQGGNNMARAALTGGCLGDCAVAGGLMSHAAFSRAALPLSSRRRSPCCRGAGGRHGGPERHTPALHRRPDAWRRAAPAGAAAR